MSVGREIAAQDGRMLRLTCFLGGNKKPTSGWVKDGGERGDSVWCDPGWDSGSSSLKKE